jgi:hypothetical protein
VDGDKVAFLVKMGEMAVRHDGTLQDDEMKLNVKFDGGVKPRRAH